ncbi:hypothetical protein RJG79_09775 [Mycoplasmatota bacterium WC44]
MKKDDLGINDYLKNTNNQKYNPKKDNLFSSLSKKVKIVKKRTSTKKLYKQKPKKEPFTLKALFTMFDLEAGVDILDEAEVLYRKNRIIKRIVFITNILFSLFLLTRDYTILVVTFLIFLLTFGMNKMLKKLIYTDPTNEIQQKIAMYLVSVNTLTLAIAMFINLRIDALNAAVTRNMLMSYSAEALDIAINNGVIFHSIANVAYGLVFFSLTITAFYQNKYLMKHISYLTLFLYTVIHFTVIYPTYTMLVDTTQLAEFIQLPEFRDIMIRTMVLVLFLLALNFNVRISEKMNDERKKELNSRRLLEKDFLKVVDDVFDGIEIFNSSNLYKDKFNTYRCAQLSRKLGGLIKLNLDECNEVFDFCKIHIDKREYLTLLDFKYAKVLNQKDYSEIKERTKVGREVIHRLRINQYAEDLVRNHCQNAFEKRLFTDETISLDVRSQLVLIADIYDALRMDRLYKDEFTHLESIRIIRDYFSSYFEFQLVDRFIRFENEFKEKYDNFILN